MRTAQQSQAQSLSLTQFWTCRWAVQNWSVFVTSSFFKFFDCSFEGKSSSEDRKAINMENLKPKQDLRSLQSEKSFISAISAVHESAPQYVCMLVLQHQGTWMSFLSELALWNPGGFGDFRKKKRLNARGFAREYLRSCSGCGPGRSVKKRGKSSCLHSKKFFCLEDAFFLEVTS